MPEEIRREVSKVASSVVIEVKATKQIIRYTYAGEVPKHIMDAYEKIVGNGLAKVTVGADLGIKEFGTGAAGFCSVSLSCNQDGVTIEEAARLAGELARGWAQENRQRGENELQAIITQRSQGGPGRPNFGG